MNDISVQIALADLCSIRTTAQCADIYRNERDSLKKELEAEKAEREATEKNLAELKKERDIEKAANNTLRERLAETERQLAVSREEGGEA